MRVAEGQEQEEHFSEGEPDLEPPEELAVGELDDELLLEEELDSETVLEEDVDDDILEATLEDLVHAGDTDGDDDADLPEEPVGGPADVEELDVEALDLADVEESLDRILRERLALTGDEPEDEEADDEASAVVGAGATVLAVAPCRTDEFVCRGCFLVRSRTLLADPAAGLCRDCAI
jgi:hypothetical protein